MAYEAEIEQVRASGGRVRDLPSAIHNKHELAKALLDAGRRMAEAAFKEVSDFLDATRPEGDDPDPFSHVSLYVEGQFGDMMELVEAGKQVPESPGFSAQARKVGEFVAVQTGQVKSGQQG